MLQKHTKEYKQLIEMYHPHLVDEFVIEAMKLWHGKREIDLLKHLKSTKELYLDYRKFHKYKAYPDDAKSPLEAPYSSITKEDIEREVYNGLLEIFETSRYPLENAIDIGILTLQEWRKQNS